MTGTTIVATCLIGIPLWFIEWRLWDGATGERWLEVSPAEGSSNLCLVASRPERPAGVETGIVLFSADVLADLAALEAQGIDADE